MFRIKRSPKKISLDEIESFIEENTMILKDEYDFSYADDFEKIILELKDLNLEMDRSRSEDKEIDSKRASYTKRLENFIISFDLPEERTPDSMTAFLNDTSARLKIFRDSIDKYKLSLHKQFDNVIDEIDSRFDVMHSLFSKVKKDILSLPSRRIKKINYLKENIRNAVSESEFINQDINSTHQQISELTKERDSLNNRLLVIRKNHPDIDKLFIQKEDEERKKEALSKILSLKEAREYSEIEYKADHLDEKISRLSDKKRSLEMKRSELNIEVMVDELGTQLTDLTGEKVSVSL